MDGIGEPHSIWLTPGGTAAGALSRVIADLAQQQGTEPFAPHVTVLGDLSGDPERTRTAAATVFSGIGPVRARVTGLGTSARFFMAFYLQLPLPDPVLRARDRLASDLTPSGPSPFVPHLSLAYGALPAACTQDALKAIARPFIGADLELDRLVIVHSAKSVPIADWAERAAIRLQPPS